MTTPIMRIWDEAKQKYVGVPAIAGTPGEPGRTPVKGVDYFTPADIREIVEAVAEEVPVYEHPKSLKEPVMDSPGDQTPSFGGAFTVRFPHFNEYGHAVDSIDKSVTIPNNTATESVDGLMSKDDKKKLDVIDSSFAEIKDTVDNLDILYLSKQGGGVSGPIVFGQGGSIFGYDEPDGSGSLEFTASKVRQNGAELATKEYADSKVYKHPTESGYKHIPAGGSSGKILRWSEAGAAKWDSETVYTHPTFDIDGVTTFGDQDPSFGGMFYVQFPNVDRQGHTYSVSTRSVTIPNNTATKTVAGLMSASDKSKLNDIEAGANKYVHPSHEEVSSSPGDQSPAFGGSFTVRFPHVDSQGHVSWAVDKKVTIPSNTATESAAGLMSKDDKKKLDVINSSFAEIKETVDNLDIMYLSKQGGGVSGPIRFGQGGSIFGYDEPDGTGSLEFTASKVRQNGEELATKAYADSKAYTHPTGSGYKHIPSGGSSGKILRWASDGTAKWDSETVYTHPSFEGEISSYPGDQVPSFGGTFTVRFPLVNSQGHTIFAVDKTVTIPSNTATTSAAGLMSASDKSTLGSLNTTVGSLNTTVSSIKPIVDNLDVTYVKKSGGAVSGPLSFGHGASIEGSAATNGASVLNLNASQLLQNGAELATKTNVNGKIPSVPTKVSQLQNDLGYITGSSLPTVPHMYTLWSDSSGSSSDINLNGGAQAFDYAFMDIEYTDGSRYMTQRVYEPNGKSVELSRVVSNGSSTYIHSSVLTINGSTIKQSNQYQTTLTDSGDTLGISTTSPLKVTMVVGWQIH